jgi:hypothetical protein
MTGCAFSLFLKAHQMRKGACAFIKWRLGKKLNAFDARLSFSQKRAKRAIAHFPLPIPPRKSPLFLIGPLAEKRE